MVMDNIANIPANLNVGDSASWLDDAFIDADGKSYGSGQYTLTYNLRGPGAAIDLTAVASGAGWKTSLTTITADTLTAGIYWWAAVLTASGERVTIAQGQLAALAKLSAAGTAFDGRSPAEKAVADAETALSTWKSSNGRVKKYTIGSRSMEFAAVSEIMEILSYWRLRVFNERKARNIADGLGDPSNLYVRFR